MGRNGRLTATGPATDARVFARASKAQINGNGLDGGFVYQNIKQYVDAPSTAYNNNDITAYGY